MAVRLHTNPGQVPERERLDTSPDTVLVHVPSIGATARSKGSFYAIATVRDATPRAREATRSLLETVQREYYYDESAGIAMCLEKAIRMANRRLLHAGELHLPAGHSIGAVVAVARERELYVATVGDADAFLARRGELLTIPDDERGPGLPTHGDPHVDVWRGEVQVGDVLLLATADLAARLGTEELRQSITSLRPAAAAEHLHHRLVTEGAAGSDAVLVVEATEVPATRIEHRLVPVRPAEPLAGLPERSPIPLADSVVEGVTAVQGSARRVRGAWAAAVVTLVDAVVELMPRRANSTRQVRSSLDRRVAERRVARAILAALAVILVAGVGIWATNGHAGRAGNIVKVNAGEDALVAAQQDIAQVFGGGNLIKADPQQALATLRDAWHQLAAAERSGVPAATLASDRTQVSGGLDELYGTIRTATTVVVTAAKLDPSAQLSGLVLGPDGAAYAIDRTAHTVVRFDLSKRTATVIVRAGSGSATAMGDPWLLTAGGPDVVILDRNGALWRWRPADRSGHGTFGPIVLNHSVTWGGDVTDIETYLHNADAGLYNLYVVDPSSKQILRYAPAADGSGFPSDPTGYLATAQDVAGFEQLFIDGDIYALGTGSVTRFVGGRPDTSFTVGAPPDDADLRPGYRYELVTATSTRGEGTLYVYDAIHQRVLAFDKAYGDYRGQYIGADGTPAFADVRGMVLLPGAAPSIAWVTSDRLYITPLRPAASPSALPAPGASATPRATKRPVATKRPTPRPTVRPTA